MSSFGTGLLQALPDADATCVEPQAAEYSCREVALRLTAALALICALIHVGAAVDHFREYALYSLVFSLLAVAQFAWAALLVLRPTGRWLAAGCGLQLGVVLLWALSRTVGVPIAPTAWVPEQVGVADLTAVVCELVSVAAVVTIMSASRSLRAERVLKALPPLLLGAALVGVLLGTGAHAG